MRSQVISRQMMHPVEVGRYRVKELESAEEIFITNSLMGVVPVTNFIGQSFPIGMNTRKIKALLNY